MSFEIRPTIESDAYAVLELQVGTFSITHPNPEEGVSQEWIDRRIEARLSDGQRREFVTSLREVLSADSQQLHLVAHAGDDVIGFVHATKGENEQHLAALYVDTQWQRQCVGSALMTRAVEFWSDDKPATLEVIRYSHPAIIFYEGFGFGITQDPVQWFDGTVPLITMQRPAR